MCKTALQKLENAPAPSQRRVVRAAGGRDAGKRAGRALSVTSPQDLSLLNKTGMGKRRGGVGGDETRPLALATQTADKRAQGGGGCADKLGRRLGALPPARAVEEAVLDGVGGGAALLGQDPAPLGLLAGGQRPVWPCYRHLIGLKTITKFIQCTQNNALLNTNHVQITF